MISFIIPFHNEEKNAAPMVARVVSFGKLKKWKFEVIPVDDRSNDATRVILEDLAKTYPMVKPLYRKRDDEEQGNTMGTALAEGTRAAKGDIVIWTMGDLADDPDTYGSIVGKIEKGYDIVFGSRYMPGGSRGNLDRLKAFLSSWGTRLAWLLFGVPVHDITNAFRGFRKDVFLALPLEEPGFAISPEFAIKSHLAGYKLSEVPTVYTNRVEGVSSFKLFKMTRSYLRLFTRLFLSHRLLHHTHAFS